MRLPSFWSIKNPTETPGVDADLLPASDMMPAKPAIRLVLLLPETSSTATSAGKSCLFVSPAIWFSAIFSSCTLALFLTVSAWKVMS